LLSESQERMLVVVDKGKEDVVERIFDKWDLNCAIIGEVIDEDRLYFYMHNELVADIPAAALVLGGGAPVYDREFKEPAYFKEYKKFKIDDVVEPENYKDVAFEMIQNPNIASKKWVIEQYDTMVGTGNMSTNFPADAGIYNIKGTDRALAMTVDCNARYVNADPEKGTAIAVAEAARNIVCSGGTPLAVTNCLNFGNPYNPEVYWQFVHAIKGMSHACKKFNTPVTGGNVSFYNQMQVKGKIVPVFPTPTIGMIGLIENKNDQMSISFKNKGDMIYLVGKSRDDINSSEYLYSYHKIEKSPAPYFDLEEEHHIQEAIKGLIKKNLILSAHDVSDGGLFVTLIESAMVKGFGFDVTSDAEIRKDAFLFGESQSRVVVTVPPSNEDRFIDFMIEQKMSFSALGHVTKSEFRIDDNSFGFVHDIKKLYENALENILKDDK
ncbi:MAG: AIR synthase-related protein, partial [Bacteroidota bacterium]